MLDFRKYLIESSTDEAKKTLDAIVGFLKKQNDLDQDGKEMLEMGKGMQQHFKDKGSFSPGQAKWIYSTSKALFK